MGRPRYPDHTDTTPNTGLESSASGRPGSCKGSSSGQAEVEARRRRQGIAWDTAMVRLHLPPDAPGPETQLADTVALGGTGSQILWEG